MATNLVHDFCAGPGQSSTNNGWLEIESIRRATSFIPWLTCVVWDRALGKPFDDCVVPAAGRHSLYATVVIKKQQQLSSGKVHK